MLRRFWRWLVGPPPHTRDGYYVRVEYGEAGTIEYGVRTWEEFVQIANGARPRDKEAQRKQFYEMFNKLRKTAPPKADVPAT